MITPEPPAGSEHYREGWRHGYEQAAIDRERSADAVKLVPDTGAGDLVESVLRICSELNINPEDAGWADEIIRRAQRSAYSQGWHDATEQARKAMARRAVPDTGQAPDVAALDAGDMAALLAKLDGCAQLMAPAAPVEVVGPCSVQFNAGVVSGLRQATGAFRALLGTDTTAEAGQ